MSYGKVWGQQITDLPCFVTIKKLKLANVEHVYRRQCVETEKTQSKLLDFLQGSFTYSSSPGVLRYILADVIYIPVN